MDDVRTTESTLTLPSDSHVLYTKTWHPSSRPPVARLVFLHGFSDHCNWYDTLFRRFATKGIKTYSFDQRGWGRSVHKPSQKGLTGDTGQVIKDIGDFVRNVSEQAEKDGEDAVPLFLGGHSMGGAEALIFMADGPREVVSRIRGVVLEAPFLAQPAENRASAVVVALGKAASRLMPGRQMVQKLDKSFMCRDAAVCDAWEADSLCHDTGTLEGLRGLLDRGAALCEGRVVVKEGLGEAGQTRIWVGHGTGDKVADFGAVERWVEGLGVEDKELRRFEGGFHKVHCEPEGMGEAFAEGMERWILERSRPLDDGSATGRGDRPKL